MFFFRLTFLLVFCALLPLEFLGEACAFAQVFPLQAKMDDKAVAAQRKQILKEAEEAWKNRNKFHEQKETQVKKKEKELKPQLQQGTPEEREAAERELADLKIRLGIMGVDGKPMDSLKAMSDILKKHNINENQGFSDILEEMKKKLAEARLAEARKKGDPKEIAELEKAIADFLRHFIRHSIPYAADKKNICGALGGEGDCVPRHVILAMLAEDAGLKEVKNVMVWTGRRDPKLDGVITLDDSGGELGHLMMEMILADGTKVYVDAERGVLKELPPAWRLAERGPIHLLIPSDKKDVEKNKEGEKGDKGEEGALGSDFDATSNTQEYEIVIELPAKEGDPGTIPLCIHSREEEVVE